VFLTRCSFSTSLSLAVVAAALTTTTKVVVAARGATGSTFPAKRRVAGQVPRLHLLELHRLRTQLPSAPVAVVGQGQIPLEEAAVLIRPLPQSAQLAAVAVAVRIWQAYPVVRVVVVVAAVAAHLMVGPARQMKVMPVGTTTRVRRSLVLAAVALVLLVALVAAPTTV
jgi:hypothetical protein